MTIVHVQGTSGSGKSTIAHTALKRFPHELLDVDAKGRPNNYRIELPNGKDLFLIGRYTTQCGGCDGIQPYSDIIKRIKKYAEKGHVLHEGLLTMGYGSIGKFSERYGDKYIFAFLDTPLEVCLERIRARRKEKGNNKPFNPENTTFKFKRTEICRRKITEEFKRKTVVLRYQHAFKDVMKLYGITVRK